MSDLWKEDDCGCNDPEIFLSKAAFNQHMESAGHCGICLCRTGCVNQPECRRCQRFRKFRQQTRDGHLEKVAGVAVSTAGRRPMPRAGSSGGSVPSGDVWGE